jgi:serine acetyltransferase
MHRTIPRSLGAAINHQVSVSSQPRIGNNVYLGVGASFLPGVNIGDQLSDGAGAIVSNDIPRVFGLGTCKVIKKFLDFI